MDEGDGMTENYSAQKKDEFDRLVWRSRVELTYPLNYLYHDYPGLAYMIMKMNEIAANGKENEARE